MSTEDRFFAAVASRQLVRPAVRAIIHGEQGFLVQRPTDSPNGHYAFIGGEYELGDSLEERLRKELEAETSAKVVWSEYRFVVENRFQWRVQLVQTLEHYFEVGLNHDDVRSNEADLQQFWLGPDKFATADVRPTVVRDSLLTENWRAVRRLAVQL